MVSQAHNNAVIRFGMGLLACGWVLGCGAHPQGGDACGGGDSCESWEVCVGGVCRASCNMDSDCPVGQKCDAALCVDEPTQATSSSSSSSSVASVASSSSSVASVAASSSSSSSAAVSSSSVGSVASTSSSSSSSSSGSTGVSGLPAEGCFVETCGASGCTTAYKCAAGEVCVGPSNTCEPANNGTRDCEVTVVDRRALVVCKRGLLGWNSAQAICNAIPGFSVASIRNAAEQQRIQELTTNDLGFTTELWIGLHIPDMNDQFQWMDGSTAQYRPWCENEPSNLPALEKCAMSDGDCWYDTGCGIPFAADGVLCGRADNG